MMSVSRKLTIAALTAIPATPAFADPQFFAMATGGYGLMDAAEVPGDPSIAVRFSGAPYGAIGAGAYASENIRLHGELFYFSSSVDSLEINGADANPSGGDISGLGMTANAQYEFLSQAKLRPFLGFGAGFASLEIDSVSFTRNAARVTLAAESKTDFVLQTDFGVSYYPTEQFSIAPSYRFLSIGGIDDDLLSSDLHLFTLRGAFHF